MKEITINGVAYVPATALTKQFRYTTDYIGQLCRAKKIDAQLVGRSWYVNPLSLAAHKSGRYAKTREEETANEASNTRLSRLDVESPVSKLEKKATIFKEANFARRIEWKPLKYEVDSEALMPSLEREGTSKRLAVDFAEGVDIAIKTSSKLTNLVAEELPTVSLKGKVSVSSLDENYNVESDVLPEELPMPIKSMEINPEKAEMIHHMPLSKVRVSGAAYRVQGNTHVNPSKVATTQTTLVSVVDEGDSSFQVLEITLVTTAGVLTLCLLLLFFGESSIQATAASFKSGINFSTDGLTALVGLFSR